MTPQPRDELGAEQGEPEGHGAPCHYCGEPCNSYAGNPGLWPIPLCHADAPGVVKWHHTSCVSERLIENQQTGHAAGFAEAKEMAEHAVKSVKFDVKPINDYYDGFCDACKDCADAVSALAPRKP